jgi:hypothetical protein
MGAPPPVLAGRDDELAYFDEILMQLGAGGTQKHLVLVGLRGVGKTVLLNEFEQRCEDAGWFGEARELSDNSRIAHIVATSARKALLEMSRMKRAGAALKRSLRALKAFSLTIGDDIAFKIDVDALEGVADSGDLAEDMRDLLVEIGEAAQAHGIGFALVHDELQYLPEDDYEALIIGLHRAKQKGLPVALVGAGLPLLPKLTGEAKTYAERGFEFRTIGALEPAAAREALTKPARDQGIDWDADAVERVLEITEGYPFFIQEYGRAIWRLGSGNAVTVAQVNRAESLILDYLDTSFFSQRIGKLPQGERDYVAAIAYLGDGPQRTSAVARKLGKKTQGTSQIRQRLIDAAVIYSPAYGQVDFTVPMCGDYVRRNYPAP